MNSVQQDRRSKGKRIELIVQQLESLPTLPAVAARLLQLTVRKNTQASELVSLIEADPSLSAKIMTLVTRGGTGLKRRTMSLKKAVVLLGFESVRNAVLSIKVFEMLNRPMPHPTAVVDRVGLWKHSLAVACAAKLLAEQTRPKIDAEEVFLCGLLHDIGKIALDAVLPKSYARVVEITENGLCDISEIENRILGIDHTIAGKRLAEKWNLPESIIETIWLHQHRPATLSRAVKYREIVELVHVADAFVRQQRIGYSGNHQFEQSPGQMAEALGCPPEVMDQLGRDLVELVSDRAGLIGLDDIEPTDLYHEALTGANHELGVLNLRLSQQNQRLQVRSRYFDLIHRFSDQLSDCRSITDACTLVTDLWTESSRAVRATVFVLMPDESVVQGALRQGDNGNPETFCFDLENQGDTLWQHSFDGFGGIMRSVAGHDYWLFDAIQPGFDMDHTFIIPLRNAQDAPLGGICWEIDQSLEDYEQEKDEIQAFVTAVTLTLQNMIQQQQQKELCEELARMNLLLETSQQELLARKSMALIGEMACGAAHEINNPLAIVVGRAQLLASDEPDDKKRKMLNAIVEHGKNASAIVTAMQEFAQPGELDPSWVSVAHLVEQAVEPFRHEAQERQIIFDYSLDEDLPEIHVDAEQMRQTLTEIVKNALEAQSRPGTIHFAVQVDQWHNKIILEITDQGCGMNDETLGKAMSPFYSEKTAGRKPGLGLSRAHRWVNNHRGRLTLLSQPDKGTTVRVELPVDYQASEERDVFVDSFS